MFSVITVQAKSDLMEEINQNINKILVKLNEVVEHNIIRITKNY